MDVIFSNGHYCNTEIKFWRGFIIIFSVPVVKLFSKTFCAVSFSNVQGIL